VTEVCTDSVPRPSKCTEIVGGWGFAPGPTGGAYSAPPDPLAGLRRPTSKGPTSKGRGGERRGGERILLRNSFRGLVTPLLSNIWSCGRAKLAKCAVDKATASHTSNNCCVILAAQLSTNFNRR